MYFPPDGPYPSESLSHPPRPALPLASPHCRTRPQPSSSLSASPDYNQIAPLPPPTLHRITNCIWISSSQSPQPTIQHLMSQDAQKGCPARPQRTITHVRG